MLKNTRYTTSVGGYVICKYTFTDGTSVVHIHDKQVHVCTYVRENESFTKTFPGKK